MLWARATVTIIGYRWIDELMFVFEMKASGDSGSGAVLRKRRVVGAVAVALLIVFLILLLPPLRILNLLEWLIAAVLVALVANFVLRRIGRPQKPKNLNAP